MLVQVTVFSVRNYFMCQSLCVFFSPQNEPRHLEEEHRRKHWEKWAKFSRWVLSAGEDRHSHRDVGNRRD